MKFPSTTNVESMAKSHPARGAWVEITEGIIILYNQAVAPRKGCVG